MANTILENDQDVWHCANTMLAAIYEELVEIIKSKNVSPDTPVFRFIESLDQDTYGRGCICEDISDYLKEKKDKLAFAQLFKEAIDNLKAKYNWEDERYNYALQFYNYLTKENA